MTIAIDWYDTEETIVMWTMTGEWTIEEFHAVHEAMLEELNGRDYIMHGVIDATQSTKRPTTNLLPFIRHMIKETPLDTVVYVRSKRNWRFIEMLINTATELTPGQKVRKIKFATTVDEALQLLNPIAKAV